MTATQPAFYNAVTSLTRTNGLAPVYYKTGFNIPDVSYDEENGEGRCTRQDACVNLSETTTKPGDTVLFYEVHYPTCYPYATEDTLPPVIFFCHSGGASDCSSISNTEVITDMCIAFAERGFVVFNIEYRRGRVITDAYGQEWNDPFDGAPINEKRLVAYTTAQLSLAYFRGFQDARGAIRTILERNANGNLPYKFDSEKIFLAGASVGSFFMLSLAYYTDAMVDQVDAGVIDANVSGPLNWNVYDGATTINFRSNVKGILNMWGNMLLPADGDALSFFANAPKIPLISFQGYLDKVCPPHYEPIYYTPFFANNSGNAIFSEYDLNNPQTENLAYEPDCLLNPQVDQYKIPAGSQTSIDGWRLSAVTAWCFLMQELPVNQRVYSELYVDRNMGHGVTDPAIENFGLPNTSSRDDVYEYIMERAATFYQACLQGTSFLNLLAPVNRYKVFVDCLNYRVRACNSTDAESSTNCSYPTSAQPLICNGLNNLQPNPF